MYIYVYIYIYMYIYIYIYIHVYLWPDCSDVRANFTPSSPALRVPVEDGRGGKGCEGGPERSPDPLTLRVAHKLVR